MRSRRPTSSMPRGTSSPASTRARRRTSTGSPPASTSRGHSKPLVAGASSPSGPASSTSMAGRPSSPRRRRCDPRRSTATPSSRSRPRSTRSRRSTGLSTAWARLFYLYGPHEDRRRLIADIASSVLEGREVATGPGRRRRDYMFIADAGDALAAVVDQRHVTGPINIATGDAPPVRELVELVAAAAGDPGLVQLRCPAVTPERPARDPGRRVVAFETRSDGPRSRRETAAFDAPSTGGARRSPVSRHERAHRASGLWHGDAGCGLSPSSGGRAVRHVRQGRPPRRPHEDLRVRGGWVVRRRAPCLVHRERAHPGHPRRAGRRRLPPGPHRRQQPLAGPLDQAPGSDQPARAARAISSSAASRTSWPRRPARSASRSELRGLADRVIRTDVRRDVPDALHAQDPHDRREEPDRRLDGAADVSPITRGGAARCALAEHLGRALHRPLPLPEPWRVLLVPATDPRGVGPANGARGGPRRPESPAGPLRATAPWPTTDGLVSSIPLRDAHPDDRRYPETRPRGGARAGSDRRRRHQHRHRSGRGIRDVVDVLLRRGLRHHSGQLSASVLAVRHAARARRPTSARSTSPRSTGR